MDEVTNEIFTSFSLRDRVELTFEDLDLRLVNELWSTKVQFDQLRERARQDAADNPRKGKRKHDKTEWCRCWQSISVDWGSGSLLHIVSIILTNVLTFSCWGGPALMDGEDRDPSLDRTTDSKKGKSGVRSNMSHL